MCISHPLSIFPKIIFQVNVYFILLAKKSFVEVHSNVHNIFRISHNTFITFQRHDLLPPPFLISYSFEISSIQVPFQNVYLPVSLSGLNLFLSPDVFQVPCNFFHSPVSIRGRRVGFRKNIQTVILRHQCLFVPVLLCLIVSHPPFNGFSGTSNLELPNIY